MSPFLVKFSSSLLRMMREDRSLLTERGVLIIRWVWGENGEEPGMSQFWAYSSLSIFCSQLCLLLSPSQIYRALCVLITKEKQLAFSRQIVSVLNSGIFVLLMRFGI